MDETGVASVYVKPGIFSSKNGGGARALRGVSVLSETVLFLLHYSTQRTLTGEPSNPTALLRATKPNGIL